MGAKQIARHLKLRRAAARGGRQQHRLSPLTVEAVEPRLLLSGTSLASGTQAQNVAQSLHDNIAHFEAVLAALENFGKFGNTLPLAAGSGSAGAATLGAMANFANVIETDVVTPLNGLVTAIENGIANNSGSPTVPANTGDLAADINTLLNGALGTTGNAYVTDHSNGSNVDLVFAFSTAVTDSFSLTLGSNVNIPGITFPNDFQGSLTFNFTFDFETVLNSLPSSSSIDTPDAGDLIGSFSLQHVDIATAFTAQATLPSQGLEANLGLLTLDVGAGGASLDYSGGLTASLNTTLSGDTLSTDASNAAGGNTAFLNDLVAVSVTNDPAFSFNLPLGLAADSLDIPGLSQINGSITVTGNVLDGNWSATVTGLDALKDFATFSPTSVLNAFESLDTYIGDLAQSQLANATIPFTDGTTIGEVLDFAQNFKNDVIDKLEPVSDILNLPSQTAPVPRCRASSPSPARRAARA
jgi:hypothetical protein